MDTFTITLSQPIRTIHMGAKGARKAWTQTIEVDLRTLPNAILEELVYMSAQLHIQAASGPAEEHAEKAHKEALKANPGAQPWTFEEVVEHGIELMRERYALMQQGDLGKKVITLSPVDRRALELIVQALRSQAKAAGKTVSDDQATKAAHDVLSTEVGGKFKAAARNQLEEEARRQTESLASLGDLLQGV